MSTPLTQQLPPPIGVGKQAYTRNSGDGSVGPVIGVLAVITVLGVIAAMIGRLCSGRRVMGLGEYDIESWVETKCSSCVDGTLAPPPLPRFRPPLSPPPPPPPQPPPSAPENGAACQDAHPPLPVDAPHEIGEENHGHGDCDDCDGDDGGDEDDDDDDDDEEEEQQQQQPPRLSSQQNRHSS